MVVLVLQKEMRFKRNFQGRLFKFSYHVIQIYKSKKEVKVNCSITGTDFLQSSLETGHCIKERWNRANPKYAEKIQQPSRITQSERIKQLAQIQGLTGCIYTLDLVPLGSYAHAASLLRCTGNPVIQIDRVCWSVKINMLRQILVPCLRCPRTEKW